MDANIVMLGTVRFLTRRFIGEYGHIESIYSHNVLVDGRETAFNIWDAPCSQCCESSRQEKQAQWADGFILNYHGVLMVFHGLAERIREARAAGRKPAVAAAGIKGIVKSMSAVFARKRTESL
ncbi:hypothetical protein JZ751_015841 [Albula glossodonta]|uniref:small monomeric GTPase n=1 Tax=Albula glossodonta TaxID=121402 RepID=A0A8T2MWT6_9TELE|nr:hypothetical protein JZ751_008166 [Albula glossodonta]KAG9332123.1 hypothetical protein JZ751_015841 [Albula glossodonta]